MENTFKDLRDTYPFVQRRIISTICQTLLYGIYLCLVPIAINLMVMNGLQSRARKWLLALATFIFALSTVAWIFSVILTFIFVNWWGSSAGACYDSDDVSSCIARMLKTGLLSVIYRLEIFDDIFLINVSTYIIADGIIVWRAWVLCSDQSKVVLVIPVVMLVINTVIYLAVVVLAVIGAVWEEKGRVVFETISSDSDIQLVYLSFSLLINIFATSIIALKAWKYRKLMAECGIGVRTPRQAIKILALLVESGVIYILIGIASLISIVVCLSSGLQDISSVFLRMNAQLVGMYPIAVVLLVEKNRSFNSTFGSFGTITDVRGGRMESMSFAPGPVLASGGQIDLATKPPNAEIHVTFVEPRDEEMSTGRHKVSSEEHAVS